MFVGGIIGQACGHSRDMILSFRTEALFGGVKVSITPWDYYRGRWFAIFVNGIWWGNYYAGLIGDIVFAVMPAPGVGVTSIYAEEVGPWSTFPADKLPQWPAQFEEALTARCLLFRWHGNYKLTPVVGSAQVSITSISGARRGGNVDAVPGISTRGRLSLSVTASGSDWIVRFWAGERLVAEGARTGTGALTCAAMNYSGLSVACSLDSTGELKPGIAFVDLRWPKKYQIHYAKTALSFPRQPQDEVFDNGGDSYQYITPELAGGSWNYNVIEVDDDGNLPSGISAPADSPRVLLVAPKSPTITSISGTAAALTVKWRRGESGCVFTLYRSNVNEPVNYGTRSAPAPIVTLLDETSAVLSAITGYAPEDREPYYDALVSAIDSAVAACNTAFDAGETGFAAALGTLGSAIDAVLATYQADVHITTASFRQRIKKPLKNVSDVVKTLSGDGLSTHDWQFYVGPWFGDLLRALSIMLDGSSSRYVFPNGAIPHAASGAAASGAGARPDGGAGANDLNAGISLFDLAQPFIKPGLVRIVLRAIKNAVQDRMDTEYLVEFDADGNIVKPRPAQASFEKIDIISGLTLTALISVREDNAAAEAAYVDLCVVAADAEIDPGAPVASAMLPLSIANYHRKVVSYTAPSSGWYKIAALARTAAGARSQAWTERLVYLDTTGPGSVDGLNSLIVRGQGIRG